MKNKPLRSASQLSLLGSVIAVGAMLAAACQGEQRELGYTRGEREMRGSEPTEPFFTRLDEFVGRWVGTAEDPLALGAGGTYTFPSGSSRFTLDISVTFSEELQQDVFDARLTFGEGEPPAPPTDPDAGYPVGVSYLDLLRYDDEDPFAGTNPDLRLPPFEGFGYRGELLAGVDEEGAGIGLPDGALTLAFGTSEPLAPWCRLQTPFEAPNAPGLFQCQEFFGGGFEVSPDGTGASCTLDGPNDASACPEDLTDPAFPGCVVFGEPVATANCDKLFMCAMNFCQCDAVSCDVPDARDQLVLRREGDELVGVFAGTTFLNARNFKTPLGELRLQRVD
jgi:hypothetical protein